MEHPRYSMAVSSFTIHSTLIGPGKAPNPIRSVWYYHFWWLNDVKCSVVWEYIYIFLWWWYSMIISRINSHCISSIPPFSLVCYGLVKSDDIQIYLPQTLFISHRFADFCSHFVGAPKASPEEIGEWLSQVCTEKGGLDPTMLGRRKPWWRTWKATLHLDSWEKPNNNKPSISVLIILTTYLGCDLGDDFLIYHWVYQIKSDWTSFHVNLMPWSTGSSAPD